jgi:hypothetical protein
VAGAPLIVATVLPSLHADRIEFGTFIALVHFAGPRPLTAGANAESRPLTW